MTNAHRTITTLLAVIAVLLAINLAVTAPSHEAQAQGVGPPVVAVALQTSEGFGRTVYRMFSDGTVERNTDISDPVFDQCVTEWCGWEAIPELPFVP